MSDRCRRKNDMLDANETGQDEHPIDRQLRDALAHRTSAPCGTWQVVTDPLELHHLFSDGSLCTAWPLTDAQADDLIDELWSRRLPLDDRDMVATVERVTDRRRMERAA